MAGSRGKITDELFQRIYRYSQAHPNKNTCEMFHISQATLTYIKRAANYKEYKETVRVISAKARANTKIKQTKAVKTEPIESPFKEEPKSGLNGLFGKQAHIPKPAEEGKSLANEKVKTLEAQITGLKSELEKTKKKNAKLSAELSEQTRIAARMKELLDKYTPKAIRYDIDIENCKVRMNAAIGAKRLAEGERDQLKEALKKNMELVDDLETKYSNDQVELAAKDEQIKSLEQRVANQRENLKKAEEVAVANERLKDKIAALERVNAAATTFHQELEDYEPVDDGEPITLTCQDHAVRNILVGVGLTIVVAFATVILTWLIRGEF